MSHISLQIKPKNKIHHRPAILFLRVRNVGLFEGKEKKRKEKKEQQLSGKVFEIFVPVITRRIT